ncbi:MAG: hypothetical protein K5660_01205 [Paludibacteraceae bacterium]|nr:hypothetical protein [Paludibacteraceae bacterium]
MKKTYCLPTTDIIQYVAMERIMDATIINSSDVPIQPADPDDPGALMQ